MNSDMRDTSCNIALNRRRDLTLRQDLCFYTEEGKKTLGEVFKVSSSLPLNNMVKQRRSAFTLKANKANGNLLPISELLSHH